MADPFIRFQADRVVVTGSRVIANSPVGMLSLILVASSGGVADITLYDGGNDTEEAVLVFKAPTSDIRQVVFHSPLVFRKGLYIKVGSNLTSCLVQFFTVQE